MRQRALYGQLRLTVAVDGILRVLLVDWRLDGLAVGGAGGGEHEMLDAFGGHGLEHAQRPADIVPVVLRRLADRLADVEECGEMHHG
jgi:hypothetical protein